MTGRVMARFVLFVVLFGFSLFLVADSGHFVSNLWSIRFLSSALAPTPFSDVLAPAPIQHRNSTVWMAYQYLAHGQYQDVINTTRDAALQGDLLAATLAERAYLALGQNANAMALLAQHYAMFLVQHRGGVSLLQAEAKLREIQGQPDAALAILRGGYEADGEALAISLADFLSRMGRITEGVAILDDVLSNYKHSPYRQLWFAKSVALFQAEQNWSGALVKLDQWQEEYPTDKNVFIQRGWTLYWQDGNVEAATKQFEQVIILDTNDGIGYLQLASVLYKEKRHREAQMYYAQATTRNPNNREWLLAQANNLQLSGDLESSLFQYGNILKRFPSYGAAYYQQAWVYYLLGQYSDALNAIQSALQMLDTPNQYYYERAGLIAEQANEVDLAISYYETTLRIDPNNDKVLQALDRLQLKKNYPE